MNAKNDIVANIATFGSSTIFSKTLTSCGLIQTFNNHGPLTVFLPPDSAFKNLQANQLNYLLLPVAKYDLIALLTYHALPGNISAKAIAKQINRQKGLAVFRTISGAPLKAQFDDNGNIVLIDQSGGKSIIKESDLKQQNGVIHMVSNVLMPDFKPI